MGNCGSSLSSSRNCQLCVIIVFNNITYQNNFRSKLIALTSNKCSSRRCSFSILTTTCNNFNRCGRRTNTVTKLSKRCFLSSIKVNLLNLCSIIIKVFNLLTEDKQSKIGDGSNCSEVSVKTCCTNVN